MEPPFTNDMKEFILQELEIAFKAQCSPNRFSKCKIQAAPFLKAHFDHFFPNDSRIMSDNKTKKGIKFLRFYANLNHMQSAFGGRWDNYTDGQLHSPIITLRKEGNPFEIFYSESYKILIIHLDIEFKTQKKYE